MPQMLLDGLALIGILLVLGGLLYASRNRAAGLSKPLLVVLIAGMVLCAGTIAARLISGAVAGQPWLLLPVALIVAVTIVTIVFLVGRYRLSSGDAPAPTADQRARARVESNTLIGLALVAAVGVLVYIIVTLATGIAATAGAN